MDNKTKIQNGGVFNLSYLSEEFEEAVKLGRCIVCGDRVKKESDYLTTVDGYCHRDCLL